MSTDCRFADKETEAACPRLQESSGAESGIKMRQFESNNHALNHQGGLIKTF